MLQNTYRHDIVWSVSHDEKVNMNRHTHTQSPDALTHLTNSSWPQWIWSDNNTLHDKMVAVCPLFSNVIGCSPGTSIVIFTCQTILTAPGRTGCLGRSLIWLVLLSSKNCDQGTKWKYIKLPKVYSSIITFSFVALFCTLYRTDYKSKQRTSKMHNTTSHRIVA